MRFNIIDTNTTLEGHRRLYDALSKNDGKDSRHVILVPDRFTLGVEKDLVRYCFPEGYSNADVVSFTRFAVKTVGRKIKKCLTKEGTVILLRKVMEKNADRLRYYKRLTGYGFAKEAFAAIASLRSGGISPEDIEITLAEMEGVIRDKLSDIALIMKEYDRELKENYTDTITRIDALIEYINKYGVGERAHFYILGFNFYSAQQMAVIKALIKNAESVSISAAKENGRRITGQIDELMEFCRENGVEITEEEAFRNIDAPFDSLRAAIFGGGKRCETSNKDKVRLFREDTPYEEVLSAAREIKYLTRRENYRYKDIAVVCNDLKLLPVVRETFARCEIHCFIDEGYAVLDGVAVRYVMNLLKAADEMAPSDVFKVVRHPFFGLTRAEYENFEKYCVKYNVRYRRFAEPFLFGDSEEPEKIRKKFIETIADIPRSGLIKDFCEVVKGFIRSDAAIKISEKYLESDDERLQAAGHCEEFLKLLEDITLLIGEEQTEIGDFLSLLKSASADMKVVLRPDYCDSVFVGNCEESRFSDVKALFVLGASDGYFPIKSGDGLIFSAADNEFMRRHGLNVYPSPIEKNAFERFIVRDLLSKPSERLYIGCAETDLGGDVQSVGEGFSEISYILGGGIKKLEDYHGFDSDGLLNYRAVNLKNLYYEYVSGGIPAEYRETAEKLLIDKGLFRKPSENSDSYPFDSFFSVDGDGNFVTSVSQLECYFACPFRHFMRYGLRAEEEEDSVLRPYTLGNVIHNVLENFFTHNLDKVYEGTCTTDDMLKSVEREFAKSEYERYFSDPVSAHILAGVKKECLNLIPSLIENMRASDFRPIGFEVGFGYRKDDCMVLIEAKNCRFKLCGRIDRVDSDGDNVIIIDYKTGAVKPELKDVYCGRKIQLYVYLSYYLKKGYRPAGVFYLPIRSGNTAKGRSYAYVGQMLNDVDIFTRIDNRAKVAEDNYDSPTVAFKAKIKDGGIKLNTSVNLLTESEFNDAAEYVERLIERALSEIMEGYAEKKPLKGGCENCIYNRICGDMPEREVSAVRADIFAPIKEDTEEEAENDGER